ncbi:MAG: hypothetical protein MZV64_65005 [Ignavibacteriales bacterium]|nr:hypothetical protein [Ignavibacteriales bacterium]
MSKYKKIKTDQSALIKAHLAEHTGELLKQIRNYDKYLSEHRYHSNGRGDNICKGAGFKLAGN